MKRTVFILIILLLLVLGGVYAIPKALNHWYSETVANSISIISDSGRSYVFEDTEAFHGSGEDEINIYQATAEELRAAPTLSEKGRATIPKDAQDAAQIGASILDKAYQNWSEAGTVCVAFNERANAWVVHGQMIDRTSTVGIGAVVIEAKTGQILYLRHSSAQKIRGTGICNRCYGVAALKRAVFYGFFQRTVMRLAGKKKPVMEVRAFATEVRASPLEDGALRFEGYAALFNSWSQDLGGFREQIAPGAFTKALTADDVRALLNHDKNYVLGRNRSGTLVLTEDDRGLRFEVTAPNTQWARDLAESVKRGDIDQCSFGFRTVRDDWRTADGIDERTLLEVRLFDVSIVTYPAYPETSANVRSCADVIAEHRAAAPAVAPARVRLMRMRLDMKEKEMEPHD